MIRVEVLAGVEAPFRYRVVERTETVKIWSGSVLPIP